EDDAFELAVARGGGEGAGGDGGAAGDIEVEGVGGRERGRRGGVGDAAVVGSADGGGGRFGGGVGAGGDGGDGGVAGDGVPGGVDAVVGERRGAADAHGDVEAIEALEVGEEGDGEGVARVADLGGGGEDDGVIGRAVECAVGVLGREGEG